MNPWGVRYSTGIVRYRPFHDPVKRGWIVSVTAIAPSRADLDVGVELLDDERALGRRGGDRPHSRQHG